MPRLLIVRHGTTTWNASGRYQGNTDIPLSEGGLAQAEAIARRLRDEPIHAIYASDLQRALRTAQTIAVGRDVPVRPDPRLREISFGAWEGLTWNEIVARDPELVERWNADPTDLAPEGGETLRQITARSASLLTELRARGDDETVLLVSHRGVLSVFLSLAMGIDPRRHWEFRMDPASLSEVYLYGEKTLLTLFNDWHHLDGLREAFVPGHDARPRK